MREKRTFAERTKVLKSDEVKKKYFLVFEGSDTEVIYFDMVNSMKAEIGLNSLIELVPIIRSFSEEGWSNPKKILDRIIKDLEEDDSGKISIETFLNWIMDYLRETDSIANDRRVRNTIWEMMKLVCENEFEKTLEDKVKNVEIIGNKILEKIEEKIQKQYLKEKVQNLTDAVRGLEMFPTKEIPSEVNSSYSILLVSLGMCLYENERNYQEIFKNMDLEKAFSLIVPPENFWLVDGKSINEKLIFIRKDSIPDINHLNQFFRKVKCSDIIVTVVYYKETVELPDIFSTYHLLQKYTREHMIFLKNSVLI